MLMNNNDAIDRRTFLKGAATLAALIPLGGLLQACSSGNPTQEGAGDADTGSEAAPEQPVIGEKVLVAYFSGTGHTRAVAETIANELGADIFEILPEDPYTAEDLNYNDDSSRVSTEHPNRYEVDVKLQQVTPDNFDDYGTVFFGYPIWWQDYSWAVSEFAKGNDFTGRTVYPFCTSSSSPKGDSDQNLMALAGTGDWQEGMRFPASDATQQVQEWVAGLGIQPQQ